MRLDFDADASVVAFKLGGSEGDETQMQGKLFGSPEWIDACQKAADSILFANAGYLGRIKPASFIQDTREATDLIYNSDGEGIAVRNLQYKPDTHTSWPIRCYSHGAKTELDKLQEGCCDWYLTVYFKGLTWVEYCLVNLNIARQAGLLKQSWPKTNYGREMFELVPRRAIRLTNSLVTGQYIEGNYTFQVFSNNARDQFSQAIRRDTSWATGSYEPVTKAA